jgi:site-specific recombinase XerD
LELAGIPFEDAQGRRLDLHALRVTFGTNLSVAGVSPRVAMELMRHSDIKLTMKIYTDASQLLTAAAVASLPPLVVSPGDAPAKSLESA